MVIYFLLQDSTYAKDGSTTKYNWLPRTSDNHTTWDNIFLISLEVVKAGTDRTRSQFLTLVNMSVKGFSTCTQFNRNLLSPKTVNFLIVSSTGKFVIDSTLQEEREIPAGLIKCPTKLDYRHYVMNCRNRVTVRFSDRVKCSIIAISMPSATILQGVKADAQLLFDGWVINTKFHHLVKFSFDYAQLFQSKPTRSVVNRKTRSHNMVGYGVGKSILMKGRFGNISKFF